MSQTLGVTEPALPLFHVGDRMRKSMQAAGYSVQDMADYLDIGRGAVSKWLNGKIMPSRQTRLLWAMRTGVPVDWLEEGIGQ